MVEQFGRDNSPYQDIHVVSEQYLATVDRDLTAMTIPDLSSAGQHLNRAIAATRANINNGSLPLLEAKQEETLKCLTELHSLFVHTFETVEDPIEAAAPANALASGRAHDTISVAAHRFSNYFTIVKNIAVVVCVGALTTYAAHAVKEGRAGAIVWATVWLATLEAIKRSEALKVMTGPVARVMDTFAPITTRDVKNWLKI